MWNDLLYSPLLNYATSYTQELNAPKGSVDDDQSLTLGCGHRMTCDFTSIVEVGLFELLFVNDLCASPKQVGASLDYGFD